MNYLHGLAAAKPNGLAALHIRCRKEALDVLTFLRENLFRHETKARLHGFLVDKDEVLLLLIMLLLLHLLITRQGGVGDERRRTELPHDCALSHGTVACFVRWCVIL